MRVLYVAPGKNPEVKEIGGELKDLQEAVGGYIEAVYPFEDEVCLICNEEGKLMGLEANRLLKDSAGNAYDIICGPFIVASLGEEDFGSLTDDQITRYMEEFKEPIQAR